MALPMAVVAPVITLMFCPFRNWPIVSGLVGICIVSFLKGQQVARASYSEPFYTKVVAFFVVVLNVSSLIGFLFFMIIM